jgi:hypothetical protein
MAVEASPELSLIIARARVARDDDGLVSPGLNTPGRHFWTGVSHNPAGDSRTSGERGREHAKNHAKGMQRMPRTTEPFRPNFVGETVFWTLADE